jgi:hypothetical protein
MFTSSKKDAFQHRKFMLERQNKTKLQDKSSVFLHSAKKCSKQYSELSWAFKGLKFEIKVPLWSHWFVICFCHEGPGILGTPDDVKNLLNSIFYPWMMTGLVCLGLILPFFRDPACRWFDMLIQHRRNLSIGGPHAVTVLFMARVVSCRSRFERFMQRASNNPFLWTRFTQ